MIVSLVGAVVALLVAIALDQRSTAATWRDRSVFLEGELAKQKRLSEELRTALGTSEASVSELENRVAILAADAAEAADTAQAGE